MFISNLAYSLHLGSDKNKRNTAREKAKTTKSGTTSYANNGIQSAKQLSKVDNHNYRNYDNKQDDIYIVRGTTSVVDDVKRLYKEEFEESVKEYNATKNRDDRKIQDYYSYISNDNKHDLACEIIIELGDKEYWDTKDINFKKRMTSVYTKQVEDLELLVPNFKVASAIIHYDETSPHMHIVGVPIKYKNKNGMSKQVGKSDVFTKQSLTKLQDKMRILCIEAFNKEYNLNHTLKTKQKGRNRDYLVSEMGNYQEMKKGIEKHQKDLEVANKKSLELDNNSNEVKDIINNLKPTFTNKEKYVINQDDKDKIDKFLQQVNDTNNEYKKVKELSITLNNVDEELNNNRDKIKTLTENNDALSLRVSSLEKKIDKKDAEIEDLREENNSLRYSLNQLKNKFVKLIKLIKDKIFSKKDTREKYMNFSRDLYTHGIIDDKEMYSIKDDYDYLKENDRDIEKDDFDISI